MIRLPAIGSKGAPGQSIVRGSYIDMRPVLQPGETLTAATIVNENTDLLQISNEAVNQQVTDTGGITIGVGLAVTFTVTVLKEANGANVRLKLYFTTTAGDREPLEVIQPVRNYTNS